MRKRGMSSFEVGSLQTGYGRFVDGKPVQAWPCAAQMAKAARPFVVQQALKKLLLAKPADRFQGFAEYWVYKTLTTCSRHS